MILSGHAGLREASVGLEVSERGPSSTPADRDLLLNVTVAIGGYQAADQVWIVDADFDRFLAELAELERTRRGRAALEAASPEDFRLSIDAVDAAGHIADVDPRLAQRQEEPTFASPGDAVVDEHLHGAPHEHPAGDGQGFPKARSKHASDVLRDGLTHAHQHDHGDAKSYPPRSQLLPSLAQCPLEGLLELGSYGLLDLTGRARPRQPDDDPDRPGAVAGALDQVIDEVRFESPFAKWRRIPVVEDPLDGREPNLEELFAVRDRESQLPIGGRSGRRTVRDRE
jgi:hypothetical protein